MDRTGARRPCADDYACGAARLDGIVFASDLTPVTNQQMTPARFSYSTLPGLRIPFGSSRCLRSRISENATGSFTDGSRSRLTTPMPCSAEIEPPYFFTTAKTTALTSFQRCKYSALSAPTGWVTL